VVEDKVGLPGEFEVDGLLTLAEFAEKTELLLEEGPYDTLAGYFMARLGRLPALGDEIGAQALEESDRDIAIQLELRVIELDGRRASRFWVKRNDALAESGTVPSSGAPTSPAESAER